MPINDPEQKRAYQREWMACRRKEWLDANGPCVDCGSWDNLEVDHVDPATKVTHNVWSWSLARRQEELNKCVVRCESCHLKRTKSQLHTTICIKGHDKEVTGYDQGDHGSCSECRRERHRQERADGRRK